MKGILYLILGLFIGGNIMLFIMCALQINRINKYDDVIRNYKN